MAKQILFTSWWENGNEHTITRSSQGVTEAEIDYILHAALDFQDIDLIEQDEDNEDLANTLYLRLPTEERAIVRSGIYNVADSIQKANVIVHAYIAEEGEEVSPMLYAINNCFKTSMTADEQESLLQLEQLPLTPFPRPQFKLSQIEIKKFFSQGRLRTLAALLQSVIDAHGNQRIIILNDTYPSLKYWFYGIHSCLPKSIIRSLTYGTYLFHAPEECILVCSAPGHAIQFNEHIEEGDFVIDNIDENGCHDIESAHYASFAVQKFWNDVSAIENLTEEIDALMDEYHLNIANAVGVLKLIQFDFNWFCSAYDIHYFLGKLSTIDKNLIEIISRRLWDSFMLPDFKFKLNIDTIPLLAYIFRNTDDDVKWTILNYIDTHREDLGYQEFESFDELYSSVCRDLQFVTEFLPASLMKSESLSTYCESRQSSSHEVATFLRIIVDNIDLFTKDFKEDVLLSNALYLFEILLQRGELTLALNIVKSSLSLSHDFLRYVVVQGILNVSNRDGSLDERDPLSLPDTFVYEIARQLILIDNTMVLELVKNYAREGKYFNSTLRLYTSLLSDFPEETAQFNETLHSKAVYTDFVTDSIFYKFASLQNATREELAEFFLAYYLSGTDKNHYFESKLSQHLQQSLPVNGIETADYFLKLLVEKQPDYRKLTLSGMLCSYILNSDANDIYDHYLREIPHFEESYRILHSISPKLSCAFRFTTVLIRLNNRLLSPDAVENILMSFDVEESLADPAITSDMIKHFAHVLIDVSSTLANTPSVLKRIFNKVFLSLHNNQEGSNALMIYWKQYLKETPDHLYPLATRALIYLLEQESNEIVDEIKDVLNTIDKKERLEVYRSMLLNTVNENEEQLLSQYLSEYYYHDFTLIQKCFDQSGKKLLKDPQ